MEAAWLREMGAFEVRALRAEEVFRGSSMRGGVACEGRWKVARQRLGRVVFRFHIVLGWRPQ